jgi:hypothetical protein
MRITLTFLARLSVLLFLGLPAVSAPLMAQDLEPRRWTHLPVGTNTVAIGYAGKNADIYFNPMLGITDGTANLNGWVARYSHAFDWFGKTTRVDAVLPYVSGSWEGLVDGEPSRRTQRAGGDPLLRLSMNFYGAPALSGQDYADYVAANPVRTTIGASLAVALPLGGYDPEEFINVGRNRFIVRPQLGVLHIRGPWSAELTGSVFFFSDNDDFVGSSTLSQEPIFALQGHLTRNFENGLWLGAGMAYANGGKVELDKERTAYKVDNTLWNLLAGYRINPHHSVMLAWQQGRTQVDSGMDYDGWLLSWAFAWGR